jgi:hypothetical protein
MFFAAGQECGGESVNCKTDGGKFACRHILHAGFVEFSLETALGNR